MRHAEHVELAVGGVPDVTSGDTRAIVGAEGGEEEVARWAEVQAARQVRP